MTQRRFNYTGRKPLSKERCEIVLTRTEEGRLVHTAQFTLDDLTLPPDGKVVVEAIHEHAFQRFEYGTVAALQPPEDRSLSQFTAGELVRFVVKVIQEDGENLGLIAAESSSLRPEVEGESPGSRVSLLPVRKSTILGQLPWRLAFDESPVLLVNASAGDWRAFAQRLEFACLVYPAVCREIITRLLLLEGFRDEEDTSSWQGQWLRFAVKLVKCSPPPKNADNDEQLQWIEDVVAAFAAKMRLWQDHGRHMIQENVQ